MLKLGTNSRDFRKMECKMANAILHQMRINRLPKGSFFDANQLLKGKIGIKHKIQEFAIPREFILPLGLPLRFHTISWFPAAFSSHRFYTSRSIQQSQVATLSFWLETNRIYKLLVTLLNEPKS